MTVEEEEEEEEREGTESVTFCSDCETIDMAMCGVVSVIIRDGATVGREKRARVRRRRQQQSVAPRSYFAIRIGPPLLPA